MCLSTLRSVVAVMAKNGPLYAREHPTRAVSGPIPPCYMGLTLRPPACFLAEMPQVGDNMERPEQKGRSWEQGRGSPGPSSDLEP